MRKAALLLHRYLGLAAGLAVAVLGVTGSVLVYGDAIDRTLNPDLLSVRPRGERVSPGQALAAVREADVSVRPDLLRLPADPSRPYVFHGPGADGGGGRRAVFVDPYAGRILGARPEHGGFVGGLFRLHANLMAGAAGRQAVGWLGVVLLVLCVSGAVVWWPRIARPRRFVEGLAVRWRSGSRRTNYDLHRAGGAWTLPYLALLALTGSGLVFYATAGDLLNAVTGSEPLPPPPTSSGPPPAENARPSASDTTPLRAGGREIGRNAAGGPGGVASAALDRAWREARTALPDAELTFVYLPTTPDGALGFRARTPSELHPNGRSFVWFDRWSGERLRVDDASRADLGPKLLHALYPLHIGDFSLGPIGARWVRAAWAVLGLVPAGLLVTGFLVWWWRGNRADRPSRAGGEADEAARR